MLYISPVTLGPPTLETLLIRGLIFFMLSLAFCSVFPPLCLPPRLAPAVVFYQLLRFLAWKTPTRRDTPPLWDFFIWRWEAAAPRSPDSIIDIVFCSVDSPLFSGRDPFSVVAPEIDRDLALTSFERDFCRPVSSLLPFPIPLFPLPEPFQTSFS